MFQPIKISVKNFLSVGNVPVELKFQPGLNYIFGLNKDLSSDENEISNGSGKSTMCDSIIFALFGKTPRKIKIKDTINMQNGKGCEVEFEFYKDGDHYTIHRGLKPDFIKIVKNERELDEEATKRNANRYIENEILNGLSFDVFKNLIILNSNTSSSFFEMGKQEKSNFVNQVFQLEFLSYIQEQLTTETLAKKQVISTNDAVREQKKNELERLNNLLNQDNSNVPEKISEMEKVINDLNDEVVSIVDSLRVHIGNTDFVEDSIPAFQRYIEKLTKDLNSKKTEINNLNYKIERMRKDYVAIQGEKSKVSNSICHYCGQVLPEEKIKVMLEDINNRVQVLTNEGVSDKNKYNELMSQVEQLEVYIAKSTELLNHYMTKKNLLKDELVVLDGWKKQIDPETNKHIQQQIDECKKEWEEFEARADQDVLDYNDLKYTRDIITGKDFYGYYIGVFRDHLNKTINTYLEKLKSPHTVLFSDDLTAEVLDTSLDSHSYGNLSTGERAKVNVSLLLSLFDSLVSFQRFESTVLVLDEVLDTGIDTEGIHLLHLVLKEKVQENPNLGIYVVSHKSPQNIFIGEDSIRKITFIKQNGFTELEEE